MQGKDTFFIDDDQKQHNDRCQSRDPTWGGIDIIRQQEPRQDINEAEDDRVNERPPEAFAQLQGRRHGQGDEGADDQDADDADGNRYRRRYQDGKDVIDELAADAGNLGAVFVKSQHDQLRVEFGNDGQGNDAEGDDRIDIACRYSKDTAEQEGFHVRMDQAGTDDGNGDANGER